MEKEYWKSQGNLSVRGSVNQRKKGEDIWGFIETHAEPNLHNFCQIKKSLIKHLKFHFILKWLKPKLRALWAQV